MNAEKKNLWMQKKTMNAEPETQKRGVGVPPGSHIKETFENKIYRKVKHI